MSAATRAAALLTRRDLFLNLTRAELTARYKTTGLGFLWFVLTPLVLMAVLTVVFQNVIQLNVPDYPLFVLAGLLPWTFFQMGVGGATTSLVRSPTLIKRVRMPRAFLPLSTITANLVHFLIALGLFLILALLLGHPPSIRLAFLPLLVLLQLAYIVGTGLLLASLQVSYRDVEFLVTAALRVLFYLTPLFYPLRLVPEAWRPLYLLNPMAGIIELYRMVLLTGVPFDGFVAFMATITSVFWLVLGIVVFRRAEPDFDDHV